MSISTYIKEDLSAKLSSGRQLPPLTLDSLAEHYQVSFTPVRRAVAELIDEGLLKKQPNRRLAACAPAKAKTAIAKPEPPPDYFQIIATDLVKLSLQGEPVYLREEATAEKYNISRSAMRNIFHRLAGEGMLDHIPRRGWKLRPFRQDDLQAFIEVRELMELKALDLARPKLEPAELQRMLEANSVPKNSREKPRIDESLHQYFVDLADNAYLRDFLEKQGRYYRRLFEWEDHDRKTAIETVRQHRAILTALLEENWSAAKDALSHHILNNHPILNQVMSSKKEVMQK